MVKRSKGSRFFPGAHVFPGKSTGFSFFFFFFDFSSTGGVVDKSDYDPVWRGMLAMQIDTVPSFKMDVGGTMVEEWSFRLAAIRELFEEANVFITPQKVKYENTEIAQMQEWRSKSQVSSLLFSKNNETLPHFNDSFGFFAVQKDGKSFYEMCLKLGALPGMSELHPFAHWITPEVEKSRYNTLFYLTKTSAQTQHLAKHDQTETSALDWFRFVFFLLFFFD
jgi:8-oxo-dGTP pyrophosphatase MutT (NUDIX family)